MSVISKKLFSVTLWLLATVNYLHAVDAKPDWQVWTDNDGKQITAALVTQGPDWVKLKRKDNFQQFQLKLAELSKPDQEYLKARWAAMEKRRNGIKALLKKYPEALSKPIYRLEENHFSFSPKKKNDKPYKTLMITQSGFYDRFGRNFRFINDKNVVLQLENIHKGIAKGLKDQEAKSGGVTLIALEAQLNKEWLEKQLTPYVAEWDKLVKETVLPTKPAPPKPKPAAKPAPEKPKTPAKPEAKPAEPKA